VSRELVKVAVTADGRARSAVSRALPIIQDDEFLTKGGVFTDDLVQTWIDYKRERELDPSRLRPHPHEFCLYYDN
jgi:glutamine synthetase